MSEKKWFGKGIYDKNDKPIRILNTVIITIFLLIILIVVFSLSQ